MHVALLRWRLAVLSAKALERTGVDGSGNSQWFLKVVAGGLCCFLDVFEGTILKIVVTIMDEPTVVRHWAKRGPWVSVVSKATVHAKNG